MRLKIVTPAICPIPRHANYMEATRHSLAKEPLCIGDTTPDAKLLVTSAESLEQLGNWYLAGEEYRDAERLSEPLVTFTVQAFLNRKHPRPWL